MNLTGEDVQLYGVVGADKLVADSPHSPSVTAAGGTAHFQMNPQLLDSVELHFRTLKGTYSDAQGHL